MESFQARTPTDLGGSDPIDRDLRIFVAILAFFAAVSLSHELTVRLQGLVLLEIHLVIVVIRIVSNAAALGFASYFVWKYWSTGSNRFRWAVSVCFVAALVALVVTARMAQIVFFEGA